jgi:hypothetical protein
MISVHFIHFLFYFIQTNFITLQSLCRCSFIITEIEALYLDGEEETIAANRAFEKVITNLQILHIETSIAVEKYKEK